MILVNFSHPLTEPQLRQLRNLVGTDDLKVVPASVQFDNIESFETQVEKLLEALPLTQEDWTTMQLLLVLPGHNIITATILAVLHGNCGYFPAIVRLRPRKEAPVPEFEIAEIINLQTLRDNARTKRTRSVSRRYDEQITEFG